MAGRPGRPIQGVLLPEPGKRRRGGAARVIRRHATMREERGHSCYPAVRHRAAPLGLEVVLFRLACYKQVAPTELAASLLPARLAALSVTIHRWRTQRNRREEEPSANLCESLRPLR